MSLCKRPMAAIEISEPGEKPVACWRDTLKTSVCALPLFPTAEGPANRFPAPHLTLASRTSAAPDCGGPSNRGHGPLQQLLLARVGAFLL
jgi:hypothetical protein